MISVLMLVLAACSPAPDGATTTTTSDGATSTSSGADTTTSSVLEPLSIVVTTTIIGDIVATVVGTQATVEILMPPGADPHDFQASSRQLAAMQEADLVVANGLGLEEGLIDSLEAVADAGTTVLWLAEHLDPIPFDECFDPHDHDHGHEGDDHGHDACDDDHGHDHDDLDPHVWMDPIRMAEAGHVVAFALEAIAPQGDWRSGAEVFYDEMLAVDRAVQELVAPIPADHRYLVTNHHSLGYFADRYDFTVVATIIPGGSTLGAPSSSDLARLVDLIEDLEIPAIFAETTNPTALADAVSAEVGHDVVVVVLTTDSLGEPDGPTGTLAGLLTDNARLIADALR